MNALNRTIFVSMVMATAITVMAVAAPSWQKTSYYCDCPGGACVSSSWPCPSGYNDGSNVESVAWNWQGQDQADRR
jgi:hypothetical protein